MNSAQLIKSSSLYLIGNIANRAAGFVMLPLYTRYLSPADYGTIELVDLTISVTVISLGYAAISASMIRIYHDWQDDNSRSCVVSSAILTLGLLGILVTAAAMLFAPAVSTALFHSTRNAAFIRCCFVAAYLGNLVEVTLTYQRIKNRALFFLIFSLIQLGGMVALNTYFIAFARNGIWSFVLSRLIVTVLGSIFLLYMVFRETGMRWRIEPVRRMVVFGAPLILSAVCFFVIHFSDRFFLNSYSTLTQLGIYSLAYKFGFLITFLVGQPFGRAWNVILYEYAETAGWKENFARVIRYLVFFLFLVGLAIVLFARETLAVIATPAFRPAATVIPIVIAAYVFREAGEFFRNVLYIIKERSRRVSILTILCALLNTGLNFLLIPRYGIMGAAGSTLLTWMVYLVLVWVAAYRDHHFPYSAWSFMLLGAISAPVWYMQKLAGGLPFLWRWPVDALLLVAFAVTAIALGYFPRKDLESMRHHGLKLMIRLKNSAGLGAPRTVA